MRRIRLSVPLTTLALAGLALWALSWWNARTGAEDAHTIAAAKSALAAGKAWRAEAARLRAAAQAAADGARRMAARAAAQSATDTALERKLQVATSAADSLPLVIAQRDSARASAVSWRGAFVQMAAARAADSTRADKAEARVAELEAHLSAVIEVAECHLLGIDFLPRCPSRTASFVLGAGTTAVVVLARES